MNQRIIYVGLALLGCSVSVDDAESGDEPSEDACGDELTVALTLAEEASKCQTDDGCTLVLSLSGTLSSTLFDNQSGYLLLSETQDKTPVVEAARALAACEGGYGPSGAGIDEERVFCDAGVCSLKSNL